jgi:hypothetical protein
MSMNSLFLLFCNIRNLFPVAKPKWKKRLESFNLIRVLIYVICFIYLYHTPVLPCFGSLLYALKPKMTSPHNESDHVLSALVAVLSCWCMFCCAFILFVSIYKYMNFSFPNQLLNKLF